MFHVWCSFAFALKRTQLVVLESVRFTNLASNASLSVSMVLSCSLFSRHIAFRYREADIPERKYVIVAFVLNVSQVAEVNRRRCHI